MPVRDNLLAVEETIRVACTRSGRQREDVTLVAVSKTFAADDVSAALEAGVTDVGENRVQEAAGKKPSVAGTARWHLIGHLQSNKAREAASLFDVVQTVDSLKLARRLARYAEETGRAIDVMLQVNIGDDPNKSGVAPGEVAPLAESVSRFESLRLTGLMTIPPIADDDATRRYFSAMRALRDAIVTDFPSAKELSMGMSDDYPIAIEEGATVIRIGRAIFGPRETA